MVRKLAITIAVGAALAAFGAGAYAQETPQPEGDNPGLQRALQLTSTHDSAIPPTQDLDALPARPLVVAEDEEKKDGPAPQLIAEGEDSQQPKPELSAEVDGGAIPQPVGDPGAPDLIAEGEDSQQPKPELSA